MSDEPIGRREAALAVVGLAAAACTATSAAPSGSSPGRSPAPDRMRGASAMSRQPTIYLPHGGGPCFYMDWTMGPPDTWDALAGWLRRLDASLPETPAALLVVSAHWESDVPTLTSAARPSLLFDYSGFPPHTYELTWPVPGSSAIVSRVRALLDGAGLASREDASRGLDHGVFVPLKLSYPEAQVPVVQLSLVRGLDPESHLAIGRALAPLRDEGVLIVGSGMSFHNMRAFGRPELAGPHSARFDAWLHEAVTADDRDARLRDWARAPSARESHPREEHLLPLMVVAGAAGEDPARVAFTDVVMDSKISAHVFG